MTGQRGTRRWFSQLLIVAAIVAAVGAASAPVAAQQGPPIFQLALVDREGSVMRLGPLPPGTFAPRLSPDGHRITFDTFDGSIWIADLANLAAPRRITTGRFPMWSPDGSRLLFAGPNGMRLFWQAADGSGTPELIADTARAPESWSSSLQLVTYLTLKENADCDIWAFSLSDRTTRAIISVYDLDNTLYVASFQPGPRPTVGSSS